MINERGTILAPTFGGGANSLVTEVLSDAGIISSDFGGNPPYEKMKAVAAICYRHFLKQTNVLFIIGGKSNNTDVLETFRGMGDALREHFSKNGPVPLYVVVGRGGPNLVRGMGNLADTLDSLGVPYRFFGFDSAISEVVIRCSALRCCCWRRCLRCRWCVRSPMRRTALCWTWRWRQRSIWSATRSWWPPMRRARRAMRPMPSWRWPLA
ncbi:ATP citrate lyase citrate-binding domain-containing protein [Cypionkella sp.]|uniref:ATP citrate lyase citrate-binding domain-containing protein n=1 Tax=Cypionkella sp. TaxID=2811411 RepID=UPI0039FDC992